MKTRCYNRNFDKYALYGGRGILVCDEWQKFSGFESWALSAGYHDGLTLDRIDNNVGYTPANCRWVTQKTQCNNKRCNHLLTHNGETKTISEWAESLGVNYFTLHSRIKKLGWSAEKALTTDIGGKK